jgi:hypothetical protein
MWIRIEPKKSTAIFYVATVHIGKCTDQISYHVWVTLIRSAQSNATDTTSTACGLRVYAVLQITAE